MDTVVLLWLLCVIIGVLIGVGKGRPISGLVWSGLFGPFGVLITLCLPNLVKREKDNRDRLAVDLQLQKQQEMIDELRSLRAQVAQQSQPMPPRLPPPFRAEQS